MTPLIGIIVASAVVTMYAIPGVAVYQEIRKWVVLHRRPKRVRVDHVDQDGNVLFTTWEVS